MGKEKNIINFYYKRNIEIVQGTSSHSFPKHSHNAFCIGIVTNGTILSAAEFIKDNLNESFNLQKLSDLLRLFKNQMGVTPYQFYIQEKVKQIRKGLLKQQPISDLVFNFNFSDESHLRNTFKKFVGITPIEPTL